MDNKLIVPTKQGKELYVFLYNGYYDKPVVSFQHNSEPSWSPNPYCYDFETFLGIEKGRGLMVDADDFSPISISSESVHEVQQFIQEYNGEYFKSYVRSQVLNGNPNAIK